MPVFRSTHLWSRITKLSKSASPRLVAVAYLGTGASDLLVLGQGDVLVVDMGDGSVRSGRTDPKEILRYLSLGVRVFSRTDLHAKVFVLGNTVLVGSSNVSNHSRSYLVEAALETGDVATRGAAVRWINSIALFPVTPKLAEAKRKIYKPPKWGTPTRKSGRMSTAKGGPAGQRVWIINTRPVSLAAGEQKTLAIETATAEARLKDKTRYWIDPIRYRPGDVFAREGRVGDTVIEINHQGAKRYVWPPAVVVYARAYKTKRGTRKGVHLEREKGRRAFAWRRFKKVAVDAGLNFSRFRDRLLHDEMRQPLLKFFRR